MSHSGVPTIPQLGVEYAFEKPKSINEFQKTRGSIQDDEDDMISRETLLHVLEELGLQPQILIQAIDAQYWGQLITEAEKTTAKQLITFAVECAISY